MSIENIKRINADQKIYTTDDKEFEEYGRVIESIDPRELIATAQKMALPEEGSLYSPSCPELEALDAAREVTALCFGTLDTQIGYCYGHNSHLNAFEWHANSEINVAVTDLILLLAKRSDLKDNRLDSSAAKAFYIKKGEMVEVYATSIHFCPCQVGKEGFGCIVALPRGTNLPLDCKTSDPYLFRKNKWLIAHHENHALIDKGVVPGINGENVEIRY